ncbi:hypothetical protein Tco_0635167, partial [Tanacetum coccineum]
MGSYRMYEVSPTLCSYACSDSLLLTPLCCDDIHEVTPRVSALAGCDRLVSEPLVIENYVSLIRKKFCWGTIFLIGLKRYRDPKEEPIEKEPLMELKEIGYEVSPTLCSYACSDSLLLTPLCCDDIHDVKPRVSALAGFMSPPACASRAKFHWGIAFATRLKRYTDPVTKLRMKHTNRRVQIPKDLYPCRIESKLTKKQVGGKWILVKEMLMISKDGEISEFPEYHSSGEEEPTEQPRALNKYGFVDHPELQMNEFAPHRLPARRQHECNPKEFDGKGGAIALTRWIEKMESVFDNIGCIANQRVKALLTEEFCPSNEMEKLESEFWNHKMVGANHTGYTDRFRESAKLVPHLVTL